MGLDMYLQRNGQEVGYWRKANAIHNFFDRRLGGQSGIMNCQEVEVPQSIIEELISSCEKVLTILERGQKNRIVVQVSGCKISSEGAEPSYSSIDCFDAETVNAVTEILPPVDGFFFGSTEIDEYYKTDIEDTIKICKRAISETDWAKDRVTYYAWW